MDERTHTRQTHDASTDSETTPFSIDGKDDKNGDSHQSQAGEHTGLGFWPSFFVAFGTTSGYTGMVLMTTLIYTGWVGFVIYLVVTALYTYSAVLLGRCWNLVEAKCRDDRHPYGAIAFEAYGKWARITVNLLVGLVCFGGSAALLLVVSDVAYVILGPSASGTYCYWPLGFGLLVCPFVWLGTPKDNWLVGALSTASCALGFLLLFVNGVTRLGSSPAAVQPAPHALHTWYGWDLSLVITSTLFMLFLHFSVPVIQRDMSDPKQFNKCIVTVYTAYTAMFVPTFLVVFFAYGDLVPKLLPVEASVLDILPRDALLIVPSVMLLLHSLLVIVPAMNPLLQHAEELLRIPEEFGWRRVAFRTAVVFMVIFCAETMPQFSVLMAVLGAILNPPLAFLAPAIFYLRLRNTHQTGTPSIHSLHQALENVMCVVLLVVCPIIMVVTSAVTIKAIADGETLFVSPCYVNASEAHT